MLFFIFYIDVAVTGRRSRRLYISGGGGVSEVTSILTPPPERVKTMF